MGHTGRNEEGNGENSSGKKGEGQEGEGNEEVQKKGKKKGALSVQEWPDPNARKPTPQSWSAHWRLLRDGHLAENKNENLCFDWFKCLSALSSDEMVFLMR